MTSPGHTSQPRVKEWFRGLKADVRDGVGKLARLQSRPASPRLSPANRDHGPGDSNSTASATGDNGLCISTGDNNLSMIHSSASSMQAPPIRDQPIPVAGAALNSSNCQVSQAATIDSSTSLNPTLSTGASNPATVPIQSVGQHEQHSKPPSPSSSHEPQEPQNSSDRVRRSRGAGGRESAAEHADSRTSAIPGSPFKDSVAPSPASSGLKDALKTSMTFTQMLLKRLPDLVDGNPAKIALSLAKTVIEIKDAVRDNMDATERRIASTAEQLQILSDAQMEGWVTGDPEKPWLDKFESVLNEELRKLRKLNQESTVKRIATHEDEKSRIAESFERINEARMQFELYTNIRVYRAVSKIEAAVATSFLFRLQPSHMADHKYFLDGEKREILQREPCSPGTRVSIVDAIVKWANDPDSQDIFWLFGPAGSGKTTIAYTIARRFESTGDPDDTVALGGNFFCSRQFNETKHQGYIIRTIAYQLAHKCKGFADALSATEGIDSIIHRDVPTQLRELLIQPWRRYQSACSKYGGGTPRFLFLFDALDELAQGGGSIFLRELLKALNKSHLPGLKFLVTSRSDPDIISRLDSFGRKQLLRLQDVEKEEVQRDIAKYLVESLPLLQGSDEMKGLQAFAGELFICAATIVRHLTLKDTSISEQKMLLAKLLSPNAPNPTAANATQFLDAIYLQLLSDAFSQFHEEFFADKLSILHAFLCTTERTSTATIAKILSPNGSDDDANRVLLRLHAVLYVDNNSNVLTYHKSFTDFLFDRSRSKKFSCDQESQHRLLTEQCFRVMHTGLRFNIANIRSSFQFDCDNADLQAEVKCAIPSELSYSCRSWSRYLAATSLNDPSHPILVTLSEFLKLRVLFWIEAMNLLKCARECDPDLQRASTWARKYHPTLSQHFQQSGSFALYFTGSPASKSTPHLYLSALATWQENDGPTALWKQHFPRIPRFSTRSGRRSACLMVLNASSWVEAIALSWKGEFIVSGSEDGLVQIWDARTGEQLKRLEGHTKAVKCVAVSRDGTRVFSGSADHSMRVWDARTGEQLKVMEGHADSVISIAISADGTRLFSASFDGTVKVWDTLIGAQLKEFNTPCGSIWFLALSQDATHFAISGTGSSSVMIWDAGAGEQLRELEGHDDRVASIAFSNDGHRIVSGSADQTVRIWDMRTGKQLKLLKGHNDCVYAVTISKNGDRIISGAADKTVRIWDVQTGEPLMELKGHTALVTSVAISGDGTRIISGSWDASMRIWDEQRGGQLKESQGHTDLVKSVVLAEDGTRIFSGSWDKTLRIWDTETGEQLKVLDDGGGVDTLAVSTDGTRIVSGSLDGTIRIWNAQTGQQLMKLEGHTKQISSVAISRDGTRIISGSFDNSLRIWDAETGEQLKVMEGPNHLDFVFSVALSEDGTRIASASSASHCVKVWDALTGEQVKKLEGDKVVIVSVAFSADGSRITSGSGDHSVRIWDVHAGRQLKVLKGHMGCVYCVAFSADGTRIISGSEDHSVRVWDVRTGEQLEVLNGHTASLYSVAISRDGTRIISGSQDGAVRVWDMTRVTSEIISRSDDGPRIVLHPPYTLETLRGGSQLTGWLLSSGKADYLMFVPDPTRLVVPPCIFILSRVSSASVHLDDAALGEEWQQCYDPRPFPSFITR